MHRKRGQLLRFPNEILCEIIASLDPLCAINLLRTCKTMFNLFDSRTTSGKRLWAVIRRNADWPDPAPLGLSDCAFLRALYGRGCNMCSQHPRVRTPIWELNGLRFCTECLEDKTVRYGSMTPNQRYRVTNGYVPYLNCWYTSRRVREARYLRSAIYENRPKLLATTHQTAVRKMYALIRKRKWLARHSMSCRTE